MEIIFITIPVTLLFIATGTAIFFWASKGGQFDDLDSPAHRILFDDDIEVPTKPHSNTKSNDPTNKSIQSIDESTENNTKTHE